MEEYLRRVQSRLGAEQSEDPIHVVLGGPEPDVDTLAATLCLALHLSQKEETGSTCLPLLCGRRCDIVLPRETVRYLQRVNICESSLLWREDVDLLKLHHTGKLSLTLLRDGLLDSSEHRTLESCILRVVYHDRQQDTADDRAVSAVAAVTREILQEAAEHIGPALRENLGEALQLQTEALWMKHGRRSVQLDELKRSLEQWRDVPAGQPDLEQLLTKELKEFSDGEMTIALSSVTTDKEDWHGYVEGLKLFSHRHGYEGLVVLLSINDTIHHPRQQVAVYSNNTDILNQICCELEESSSWSLSGELEDKESFQVYHIPLNTPSSSGAPLLLKEEIKGLLKDFVDCRSSVLACHPSSRTSSTEGVAGSVEFSQGSSGINDMDGSDIERAEGGSGDVVAIARVIADGQEDTGGVGVSAGGELVSPDSGMTTIRSSRSSKESSVFLSDDSPVGDIIAGGGSTAGPGGLFLRNPSPLGLSSLSPPIPPERRKHLSSRNRNDNWDLFSFDPIHSSDHSIPGGGELVNSGVKGDGEERREGSSSLSELEELSLLDFSAPNSLGRLDSTISSTEHPGQIHGNDMNDTVVPPTPVNSLVGSRPPSSCGVRFFPEDVVERISCLQHKDSVSSSLSETWDELGFDTQGALSSSDNNTWNRAKESESPQNIVEEVGGKQPVADMTERESREEILKSDNAHQRARTLEPQLSLITEQTESYDNWTPEFVLTDQWGPVTLADLQLTPPEEEVTGKCKTGITGVKEKTLSLSKNKAALNTLTPETSTEENKGVHGEKGDRQMELLDFWTYSAQKGFLKSDSGTTTSYPESLDMWNMTIRDDSLSPLTTPDNLSENSGSFYGIQPNVVGATSVESPIGFSDCGMEMWNTTIREDSSSTITSPGGPENEKNLSHTGSVDATDSPEAHATKQVEEENAIVEERGMSKALSQTSEEVGWRGNEPNVKIVIEVAGDETQDEERGDDSTQSVHSQQYVNQNLSEYPEDETSPYQGTNMWDFPVLGMVTSTSEYDNVGDGAWSLTSSPETYASPVVDMVQLEGQSSPFIALTSPIQRHEGQYQYEEDDALGKTEYRSVISNNEQPVNQVFLFEGTADSCHLTRSGRHSVESKAEETDWTEEPSDHSPFILVDCSSTTQLSSASYHSSPGEAAENRIQTEQSSSPYHVNCNDLLLGKHDNSESASSSHDLPVIMDRREDGPVSESHGGPTKESNGKVEAKITETLSLSSSSGGERETLKYSPDSFHPGSRDELRSNSDGDSSSGLEMEYIIVSGKVREGYDRTRQGNGQSKGTRTSMETLSMLSYAATVLQSQAQAAHREHQENTDQSRQSQRISDSGCTLSAGPEQNQAVLSTHYQASPDSATEKFMAPEMISPSQSKNKFEAFHQSDSRATGCSQAQVERNYEDKSHIVARSVSPSLRYQLDDVLKTREEVYVHSQISMEDSDEDEGGQSPSALPCPTALGDFQVWGAQLGSRDTSQTTSETQSPVLTNSSVSHSSSLIGTPLSDSGVSVERGLALPFSGDLMEEENDEEEQEEGTDREHTTVPKWTSAVQSEREERQRLGSSDLLSFTEEVMGAASFQQTDLQTLQPKRDRSLQNTADYYNGQPLRTVECEKWLTEHQIGDHEASQHSYSPVLRHQDMLSQLSSQPANENAAYLWTSTQTVTQGQTQRGYNYHHIDQRTENQSAYSVGIDTKTSHQLNTADVYAEFITDTTAIQYGSEPAENYYETGFSAEYSSNDPGSKFQYVAEIQYGDDTTSMCADDQSQYETDHAHYHFDEQPLYQSDIQPQREDHARYVSEGYVQYLLSRHPQQGDSAGGMMMNMASSEEAAEEIENTEDPPSSADLSGGSGQRRKLAAPPMNVSLNHSEESLLSEDALDTGDEALDTGDDLDVSINELNTPDEGDSLEFNRHGDEANLGAGVTSASAVAGHGAAVEGRDSRLWRSVVIGEQEHRIDMKCIEPYKRVISHGGYYAEQNAIIVFAACFLPDSDCDNYNYVMENLFLYVINTLELMVAEDYMIVYLNGATPRRRMPGFTWMKRCYQMIDRRLKKNLKMFIIVHPSWFIRTLLGITRPFISSKFSSKIKYVNSLQELGEIIPLEYVHIPASIVKLDTDLQETTTKADKKGNSAV